MTPAEIAAIRERTDRSKLAIQERASSGSCGTACCDAFRAATKDIDALLAEVKRLRGPRYKCAKCSSDMAYLPHPIGQFVCQTCQPGMIAQLIGAHRISG